MATKLPLPLSSILPVPWPYRETRADREGGREGFVTPWFISPGRPIFRPRKIKCFFAARFYRNRFHRVWYASRASSSSSSASRGLICFRKLSTVNKGWGGCKNPGRFFPWKNIFGPVSSVDGPRFERWLVTEEGFREVSKGGGCLGSRVFARWIWLGGMAFFRICFSKKFDSRLFLYFVFCFIPSRALLDSRID